MDLKELIFRKANEEFTEYAQICRTDAPVSNSTTEQYRQYIRHRVMCELIEEAELQEEYEEWLDKFTPEKYTATYEDGTEITIEATTDGGAISDALDHEAVHGEIVNLTTQGEREII